MAFELKYADLPARDERLCYAEGGNPNGPVLLCIHGNYGSYFGMSAFLEESPKNYRVVIPDLRGFGRSSYNHPYSTLKEMSDDLIELCHVIGITKATVLGHSLGGGVAMQFAIDAPNITERLILVAPTSVYGYPLFKGNQKDGFKPFESMEDCMTSTDPVGKAIQLTVNTFKSGDLNACIKLMSGLGGHSEEPSERFIATIKESMLQRDLLAADWALMTWNITDTPSLYSPGTGEYKKILAPTLLFTAENDTFVLPFMTEANVNALKWKGKDFIHVTYPNCIHNIYAPESEGGQKTKFFKDLNSYLLTGKVAE